MKYRLLLVVATQLTLLQAAPYEVMLLSDTHYDAPEVRIAPDKLSPAGGEYGRNLIAWESNNIPRLLQRAGEESKKVDFTVHLGDFIQGDCGSGALQALAFSNKLAILEQNFPKLPFILKGNHDIRGPGAATAFDTVMLPRLDNLFPDVKRTGNAANYWLRHKGDLYLFFDCVIPEVDFVETALAAHPDARHVFFLTHYPIFPCNGRAWVVLEQPARREERKRLIELLAARNAIILAGHTHRTMLIECQMPQGRLVQFTSYSMVTNPDREFAVTFDGDGAALRERKGFNELLKSDKPAAVLIKELTDHAVRFVDFGGFAGYNILRVSDSAVVVDIYNGSGVGPVETLQLHPAEAAQGNAIVMATP